MAWLLRRGDVLASLDVARTSTSKICSISCDATAEATVFLRPIRVVHTVGASAPVDVAYLDNENIVIEVIRMAPFRINFTRRSTSAVLRAPVGSFDRWSLQNGDQLEVRP